MGGGEPTYHALAVVPPSTTMAAPVGDVTLRNMTAATRKPQATAVYVRISRAPKHTTEDGDKVTDTLGVERQEADCRAWCKARGWKVAEVVVDNDVSAYRGKRRPGFERMVEGIKTGRFDAVCVWHPDRLTRSTVELEGVIDLVEATGIAVGTVTAGDYDLTTPDGRLTARVVGAVARKESEDKSRRLRRKHLELAEHGKLAGGGRRPFGYRTDRVTVNQREARLVREAAERVLRGEPMRAIARDWAARGIQRPEGDGQWYASNLRRMLLSPRIAGLRTHRGVTTDAVWDGIVTVDEHVRLVAVLTDPARKTLQHARSYLLTGFLRCEKCGATLRARPTMDGTRKYVCQAGPGHPGCGRTLIIAEPLEKLVEDAVVERLSTPAMARKVAARRAKPTRGKDPAVTLVELERRERELADAWSRGALATTMLEQMASALERDRAKAQAAISVEEVAKPVRELPADAHDLARTWRKLTFDRKRAAFSALIEAVVIGPGRRGFNRFDASRVDVRWRGVAG
jgi:DNA invertase Pin-like site-specific DNA recombinase